MASVLSLLLALALFGSSAATTAAVTPVEKVVTLLGNLRDEVQADGRREAAAYDQFACFCRNGTLKRSSGITSGRDTIDGLSADIEERTALKTEKLSDMQARKTRQEHLSAELQDEEVRCAKEAAVYEETAADLTKALSSLKSALTALGSSSKPSQTALLMVGQTVERSLALAKVLGLNQDRRQTFLGRQAATVDPSDPEYRFHSHGILDTLGKMQAEFAAKKSELDGEWAKTKATCDSTKQSLADELSTNAAAIVALQTATLQLQGEIAAARESLVTSEGVLADDQLYLKDLTERCEVRAKDWDQRSQLRADELSALAQALTILSGRAAGLDTSVNQRALLMLSRGPASRAAAPAVSLLQAAAERRVERHAAEAPVKAVAALLRTEGRHLQSPALVSLALRVEADPFSKVKELIQQLVERLLQEATDEATKQSFCNTEMGKATQNRDFRFGDARRHSAELAALDAKRDELTVEMGELSSALDALREDLAHAESLRAEEKAANAETLKEARDGVAALEEAIAVLTAFYKDAAKATSLLQSSPVDVDTSGPGFEGAYNGKQAQATGILGVLAVIRSDFDRTARTTEAAEVAASAEFVEFDRASKADIGAKETQRTLDAEDLQTTLNSAAQHTADLSNVVSLLDDALKTLEELKPTCVDNGMSYAERVQKRDEEVAALHRALCILDADGVEPDCKN